MTRRKVLVLILALSLLVVPLAADAQQANKVYRVGVLGGVSPQTLPGSIEAFRQRLRDLGWVEGQNVVIEYRWGEGNVDRLPELAAEFIRLKVDIIVAAGTLSALAAKNLTPTIPIVMVAAGDPVGSGLVASLARPGGNVTGLSLLAPEIVGKQLELLTETVPRLSRLAVLWNPNTPSLSHILLSEAESAARSLRVQVHRFGPRSPTELEGTFSAMTKTRVTALLALADPEFLFHRTRIVDLAAKARLPAIYGLREFTEAGGLMSYAPSVVENWRRAAAYVDKILRGVKPGDLPVEQPTKFELVINLKTAKALGLTIPQSILIRADEMIQ